MAGWDTLLQQFPYYKPQEPEVPKPDNTAAKLISAGTETAVNAFVKGAIARRQADLEEKQMIQTAGLTMRAQDITSKDADLRYQVAKENADSLEQSRKDLATWHEDTKDEASAKLKAKTQLALNAQSAAINWEKGIATNDSLSVQDLAPLTPELMKSNPGEFIVQANDWNLKHGDAKVGAVPTLKANLDKQVNSLSIPYVPGAELVDAGGNASAPPDQLMWRVLGKDGTWVPAQGRGGQADLIKLFHDYQDPQNRQAIKKGIIAGGHGSVIHQDDPKLGKIAVPTLDKYATGILGAFEKQRETPKSETPSTLMYTTHPKWSVTAQGEVGNENIGPIDIPDLGRVDQERTKVKEMMTQYPEKSDELRAMFEQRNPGETLDSE